MEAKKIITLVIKPTATTNPPYNRVFSSDVFPRNMPSPKRTIKIKAKEATMLKLTGMTEA